MEKDHTYIGTLIVKYIQGGLSAEEQMVLERWRQGRAENQEFFDQITDPGNLRGKLNNYAVNDQEAAFGAVLQLIAADEGAPVRTLPKPKVYFLRKWWAAAVLLGILAGGIGVYMLGKPAGQQHIASSGIDSDVLPGGSKAVLTLGNGSKIVLDSSANGTVAIQGSAEIIKTDSGKLAYNNGKTAASLEVENKLATPRGGKYQLTLPDGTAVWLNAASSITFPTAFNGPERMVSITGEAYFEVTSNTKQPFRVKVDGIEITVLGTHFNVNAYTDEAAIKTTLLEGAVQVRKGNMQQLLQPGQQAQLGKDDVLRLSTDIDTEHEIAWKNNEFNFKYTDLQTVMRQLARWYDLEIAYEPGAPLDKRFGGQIPMDAKVSQVLESLVKSGVHFRLEGNKLTVLP